MYAITHVGNSNRNHRVAAQPNLISLALTSEGNFRGCYRGVAFGSNTGRAGCVASLEHLSEGRLQAIYIDSLDRMTGWPDQLEATLTWCSEERGLQIREVSDVPENQ